MDRPYAGSRAAQPDQSQGRPTTHVGSEPTKQNGLPPATIAESAEHQAALHQLSYRVPTRIQQLVRRGEAWRPAACWWTGSEWWPDEDDVAFDLSPDTLIGPTLLRLGRLPEFAGTCQGRHGRIS